MQAQTINRKVVGKDSFDPIIACVAAVPASHQPLLVSLAKKVEQIQKGKYSRQNMEAIIQCFAVDVFMPRIAQYLTWDKPLPKSEKKCCLLMIEHLCNWMDDHNKKEPSIMSKDPVEQIYAMFLILMRERKLFSELEAGK